MQGRKNRPLGVMITVFFLGIGGFLSWYGCTSLPSGSATSTPKITSGSTPTSTPTATAAPSQTLTVTPTHTPLPTPRGTADRRVLNPANQHLYLYVQEGKTWHQAKDYCVARGGHLVTIQAPSENLFVYNISSDNDLRGIWLGGTDEAEEGKWVWVTGELWDYWNWAGDRIQSQPDNQDGEHSSDANYLLLIWDQTWFDVTDGAFPYFVCEWESASP